MPSKLVLANSGYPSVPTESVLIEVEVDYSRCAPSAGPIKSNLDRLARDHLEVPISQIIAMAGKHFVDAAEDYWGIGQGRAQIQRAWETIAAWGPRREYRASDNKPKLVVDQRTNAREQAHVSEVLGAGIGLIAATKVYDLPYRFWSPTEGLARTDFSAPGLKGHVQLEVRGRFNRMGWAHATNQVYEKFGDTPQITHKLGVLFGPRTTANTRAPDLLLVDPTRSEIEMPDDKRLRALLRHYVLNFASQGFVAFGSRLAELAQSETKDFESYLAKGDRTLSTLVAERRAWSLEFFIGEHRFLGSRSSAMRIPSRGGAFGSGETNGFMAWGIWDSVLSALVDGRLSDIAAAALGAWTSGGQRDRESSGYTVLEDGTAVAWAGHQTSMLRF